MTTEKFEVRNRWTDAVQFTAEIAVTPDILPSAKLGLAVRWGKANDANLRDANLRDANLRSFKSDLWMTLHYARAEVSGLIAALVEGRVDGSQYQGECACLVGTLANVRGAEYAAAFPDHSSSHPAEQWFLMIRKGDKPGDDSGGGFAALKALDWAIEYCDLSKIKVAKAARDLLAAQVPA
jgi:uncharacterized protein YjbI with pentapeptide repeats